MALWQPKRWQVPLFNPPQYGYVTDPATLGNETGSNMFWTPLFKSTFQGNLLGSYDHCQVKAIDLFIGFTGLTRNSRLDLMFLMLLWSLLAVAYSTLPTSVIFEE